MAAPEEKDERPKRNRIVINLEKARTIAHIPEKGSRAAKILGIVAVALIVLIIGGVIGGYLWWQNYKTSPAYTLALLVDASQRNDQAAFDEIVDTDKIVDSFIPQVTEKALGRFASALSGPLRKEIESRVPALMPQVKKQVHEEVAKRVGELAARAGNKPFFLIALGVPYIVDINEEGDTAKAGVKLDDRQVELTMQRNGERWKIVGVKDDTMARNIVDKIAKSLPAVGQDLEKDLRKQVDKNLPKDLQKNLPNIPGVNGQGDNGADKKNEQ
jgi:hypothetical protein